MWIYRKNRDKTDLSKACGWGWNTAHTPHGHIVLLSFNIFIYKYPWTENYTIQSHSVRINISSV